MSADINFIRNIRKQTAEEAASPLLKLKEAEYILAMKRSQEASLYRETSVSGGSLSGSLKRRLAAIRSKALSGGRLSASEKQFLRRYAPEIYSRYMMLERERQAEKELAERRKRQMERENAELKKRAAEKRRQAKQRQKDIQERMIQDEKKEAAIREEIREYREYTRSFFKGYSRDPAYQPIMPGPDETQLGMVAPEIAGLPEAASLAVQVRHEMERKQGDEVREEKRAQATFSSHQKQEEQTTLPGEYGKDEQETDMEWNGTQKAQMEALQEAAEAQAAETRTSQGRAAYRSSAERPAPSVDAENKKTCNRKA